MRTARHGRAERRVVELDAPRASEEDAMHEIPDGAAEVAELEPLADAGAPDAAPERMPEDLADAGDPPGPDEADALQDAEPDDEAAGLDSASGPEPEPDADEAGFALPARIRHEDTEALLAHLRNVVERMPLAVDAGAVEVLTTPAVLALVAAARARADAGAPLAVERPSAAFVDAFSDLGLFHDLMKMEFRT